MDALTTVKPYSNEIHAQAQLWLKRDPKASYEAWKKCLPARGNPCACHLGQVCAGTCVSPDLIRNVLLWGCVGLCPVTSETILTFSPQSCSTDFSRLCASNPKQKMLCAQKESGKNVKNKSCCLFKLISTNWKADGIP